MRHDPVKKTETETLDDILFHLGNRISGLEYVAQNLAEHNKDSDLNVDGLCFVLFDIIDSMRQDIKKAEGIALISS